MFSLRVGRAITAALKPAAQTVQQSSRTFTTLPSLRPSLTSSPSAFAARPSTILSALPSTTPAATTTSLDGATLDLLPKISAHPGLAGIQIRCGPRNTFSPSHFVRKRRHGFLSRIRTRKGRKTLLRRKLKGRTTLSH